MMPSRIRFTSSLTDVSFGPKARRIGEIAFPPQVGEVHLHDAPIQGFRFDICTITVLLNGLAT
jgi:hypothetical protein